MATPLRRYITHIACKYPSDHVDHLVEAGHMNQPSLFDETPSPSRFIEPFTTPQQRAAKLSQPHEWETTAPPLQYRRDLDEPNTSFEAAISKQKDTPTELSQVYALLAAHPEGLTDFEIADALGIRPTSAGARRITLRDKYRVVEYAGHTKPSPSKRAAKVWRLK